MLKVVRGKGGNDTKCTPNLLPCRIHHDGDVNAPTQYWKPETTKDGIPEAYFRGRKLQGKTVALSKGYEGVIVQDKGVMKQQSHDIREDEDGDDDEIRLLEEAATFNNLVLWEHGKVVEGDDAFVKGLEEWIAFAEIVSGHSQTLHTTNSMATDSQAREHVDRKATVSSKQRSSSLSRCKERKHCIPWTAVSQQTVTRSIRMHWAPEDVLFELEEEPSLDQA